MAKIFEVTKAYRTSQNLSVRGFADAINEGLINTNVNYSTVSRWEQEKNYYEPDLRLLLECIATYNGWRAEWARDCIHAMFPDLFQSGVVRIMLPVAE